MGVNPVRLGMAGGMAGWLASVVACSSGTDANNSGPMTFGESMTSEGPTVTDGPGSGDSEVPATDTGAAVATASTGSSGAADDGSTGASLPVLASCADLLAYDEQLGDGVYTIDPDGPGEVSGLDVYCDMTRDGGGWTLLLVTSDDAVATWTYDDRDRFTSDESTVGSVEVRNEDYKTLAYHRMPFADLMFVHEPSGVWAAYDGVGVGQDLGSFIAAQPDPNCDTTLPGNGYPLTAGTLTVGGTLCDTDLYFNVGDWDGVDAATCADVARSANNLTFGPLWNATNNAGCPFDEPPGAALGPSFACPDCDPGTSATESPARGFAGPLGLNTGTAAAGENYLQLYAR